MKGKSSAIAAFAVSVLMIASLAAVMSGPTDDTAEYETNFDLALGDLPEWRGVKEISAGGLHTLALMSDGTVWAWGSNANGQIGNGAGGTGEIERLPMQVMLSPGTPLKNISAIAAGGYHSLALASDGTVWAWGSNANGQIGNGGGTDQYTPVQVMAGKSGDDDIMTGIKAIAAGGYHSLALASDGAVYAWGNNIDGQLGVGDIPLTETPMQVGFESSGYLEGITAIDAGEYYSLALAGNGTVWAWGSNANGQLGNNTTANSSFPVQVMGSEGSGLLSDIKAIAAGGHHSLALASDGKVWAWGANSFGQVGNNEIPPRLTPARVLSNATGGPVENIKAIAAGEFHSLVVASDGTMLAWGYNVFSQTGAGTNGHYLTAMYVDEPGSMSDYSARAITVSGGWGHSVALMSNGTVYSWGNNMEGQTGDGTTDKISPVPTQSGTGGPWKIGVKAIAAGQNHSLALMSDGTVMAWGANGGKLGNNSTAASLTQVQVLMTGGGPLTNVIAIAAGNNHSLALRGDGTLWAFGFNTNGGLGIGNTPAQALVATPVLNSENNGSLNNIISIAAGQNHSLALTSDGKVWAWGEGTFGQLGNNTNASVSALPVQVHAPLGSTGHLEGIVEIGSGGSHATALRSDGTVLAWGNGVAGRLGPGTDNESNQRVPVQVGVLATPLTDVTTISVGSSHTLSVKSDGTVWAWGVNGNGQVGNDSTVYAFASTEVGTGRLTDVVAVSGGYAHSLALNSDGTMWSWGANSYGQLGDNSNAQRLTPVEVGATGSLLKDVIAISAGDNFSLILLSNGTLWAWGDNAQGQLGDGTTDNKNIPTPLDPSSDDITGTATISNMSPKVDDTLTASLVGGTNTGTLSYQWMVNGTAAGTGTTYKVLPADLGKTITLVITSSAETGQVTTTTNAVQASAVTMLNIAGVTAPVTGATPVTAVTETDQYTGTVTWSPTVTTTFAPSETYTATISLLPKTGYIFTGVAEDSFLVSGAAATNAVGGDTITAVFPATGPASATTVATAAITGVTPPVNGATPVTSITETDEFTGTVTWSPDHTTFAYGTSYTATVTLTAKPGYTLDGVAANFFTVSGATATNGADSGVITAVFESTAAAVVSLLNITDVVRPVSGETPVSVVDTDQYTGTVVWDPADTTFVFGTVYEATITLAPKTGYVFEGVAADSFTVDGMFAYNSANSGVVSILFSPAGPATVTLLELFINPPVAGAVPMYEVDTEQYAGFITWYPTHMVFQMGEEYTATIELTAKEGYTFDGVAENAFTLAGATVTNDADNGSITAEFGAVDKSLVSLSAISGVTAPVPGQTPVTTITETDEFTGTVTWEPADATFASGVAYTATITLTPKGETSFAGIGENFFTVAGATATNDANSGIVTAVFPPTELTSISLLDIPVGMPIAGVAPVTTIETTQYTGTVTWMPTVSGTFVLGETYTATIVLTPKAGYTFDGVAENAFTVSGVAAMNDEDDGIVTVTFPEVDTSLVNLSAIPGIAPPVAGATPVTTIETDQYTGTVTWSPADTKFIHGEDYTATIVLTPKDGYTFDGIGEDFFTVLGATATNDANSGTITAVFPTVDKTLIDIQDIEGVFVPVAGATPADTVVETDQYTGTITWDPVDSEFVFGEEYTATITLTPKTGYVFTGVPEDFFKVFGAVTTNDENDGVITAVFPAVDKTLISISEIPGIAPPVAGATPVTEIETDQYTGIVTWEPADEKFIHGEDYIATIVLTPKEGYSLEGIGEDTFTVDGATATNDANSGTITAVFPTVDKTLIDIQDIEGVFVPVAGATPATAVTETDQFTGTITWDPVDSEFVFGEEYTATITLTPKTGYVFTGVPEDFFKVFGAVTTNDENDGVITAVFPAVDKTLISISEIPGITPPTAGAVPVTEIETDQYTGVVTWSPADDPFVLGETYTATITLTPKEGYSFEGIGEDTFTVDGATATNDANSGVVIAEFPTVDKTLVNISAIPGIIPPAGGAIPSTQVIETAQYTGTVTWEPADATFAFGEDYSAVIVLTPKTGFSLDGIGEDFFTVSGATATNDANSGVVIAVFPTVDTVLVDISAIPGITPPVTGATPVTTIETDQFTGTVTWSPADATFEFNEVYTATITLTPKTGYSLDGIGEDFFTVSGATATNDANGNVVTAVFPPAEESVVYMLDITGVNPPIEGAAPVTTIETSQYTGVVTWSPDHVTFASGETYTATIVLTPKTGYTFIGVAEDSFTVSGVAATNAADDGTVTVTFDAVDTTLITISAIPGIAPPVAGATPVTTIETDQYTGIVTWSPADAKFILGETYTATIVITPKDGFSFAGIGEDFFTVAGAAATNPANSGTITAVFPPVDLTLIDIQDIEGVYVPIAGATPSDMVIETDQYTGTIVWDPVDAEFVLGEDYVATITLVPKTGYVFTGVPEDFFKVFGAVTTNDENDGVITAVFPTVDKTLISISEIPGIAPPVAGATPVTTIETDEYTGVVTWEPADEKFILGEDYIATIVLTPKDGYSFAGVEEDFFTVDGATATNDVNSGTITAVFPTVDKTLIDIQDIEGVFVPVAGATPADTVVETDQFTGTITWDPMDSEFVFGEEYVATITLTPKTGYVFTGVPEDFFKVFGAVTTNDENDGVITAVFPAVDKTLISISEIPGIAPPVAGATPVTEIETDQYTGTVTWSPADDKFVFGEDYTATIVLTPKEGYSFAGIEEDFFTVDGATATNEVNSGTITAVFPTVDKTLVDIQDILGVNVPVANAVPVTTVTETDQYTGTITWMPADTTFDFGVEYTATITLTPKTGYVFTGVPENFFKVFGAVTTNDENDGVITAVFPAVDKTLVSLSDIPGITPPTADATPVTEIETDQYTGVVTWSPADEKFIYGEDYVATIVLTPKEGYSFAGIEEDFFTVDGATATNDANSSTITAVFPTVDKTMVDLSEISGVTPPVAGATPVTTVTETDQYTGTVTWTPADATFIYDVVYTATITITPKAGFVLTGVAENSAAVAGATATNDADSGIVTAVFSPAGPETITSWDVVVTAPVAGATPVTTIEADQFTGTITWEPADSVFVYDVVYTATITLTPKPGYTFDGVEEDFFTVDGAVATNDADSGVITAVFDAAGPATVNLNIPGITAPVEGGTPVTTIETDQFTGTVTWSPTDATFEEGVVYTATITITPKDGFTLDGVEEDSFTVPGATSVTNAAGDGVITVIFPAAPKTFSVTYDLNGGSGTIPTESTKLLDATFFAASGDALTAPEGMMFKSWNTAADGSGTSYAPGDEITVTDDVVLYAIWEKAPKVYEIGMFIILLLILFVIADILLIAFLWTRKVRDEEV